MSCGDLTKRKFCKEECKTCYKRSFANVKITKNLDGVIETFRPSKFWSESNDISPSKISANSNKKFVFSCTCGHDFSLCLTDCTRRGNLCPYHASKKLCDDENCEFCFEKSFASVEKEWGRPGDYLLDGNPRQILKSSHKRCEFKCWKCDHNFSAQIYNITSREWPCSYCKGNLLCKGAKSSKKCGFCFEKSFASHPRAKFWSNKNLQKPWKIRKYTQKKYWFDCHVCGHDFDITPSNILTNNSWCPFCSFPCKKLCGDENCKFCFEKSLASCVKKKYYIEGQKPLHTILKGGRSVKYKFICEKGHKFTMRPNNINSYQWCPLCPKKTEAKMFLFLEEKFKGYKVECQAKFDWCKNPKTGRSLYYDFYINLETPLIIEIDGPQHFKQIANWCSPEKTQKSDRYKEKMALENGIHIIRLLQADVLMDKNRWEKYFNQALEELDNDEVKIITITPKGVNR